MKRFIYSTWGTGKGNAAEALVSSNVTAKQDTLCLDDESWDKMIADLAAFVDKVNAEYKRCGDIYMQRYEADGHEIVALHSTGNGGNKKERPFAQLNAATVKNEISKED